jgi:hypothetical protein
VMVALIPGVMSGRGVPARALTLPYYLMMVGGIIWSMLTLPVLRFDFEQRYPRFGRAIRMGALALVVMIVIGREIREAPERIALAQRHAAAWDVQEAAILAAKARGETRVVVDAIPALWLTEGIGPDTEFYVNTCAAYHYGLDKLRTP